MEVSKEEILHIAQLAHLQLKEEEIQSYIRNLEDILNYANVVNGAPIEGLATSVGTIDKYNVFRKDEVKIFEDNAALLQNAPEKEENMFKIPKVL